MFGPLYIKPLLQNAIIEAGNEQYKVDRWFKGEMHSYTFICLTDDRIKDFSRSPLLVQLAIKENKIKIISNGTENFWNKNKPS